MREPLVETQGQQREVERILRQQVDRRTDVALDGLGGFPEERVWDPLATRNAVALPELEEHDPLGRVGGPRDHEGNGEMQLDRTNVDLHMCTAARSA